MVSITKIMAFENDELSLQETVEMFAEMIKDGSAWSLQGSYGRTASALIKQGYVDKQGNINQQLLDYNS